MARYRKNGFQFPMSSYQKKVIFLYPIITIMYYIMIIFLEKSTIKFISLLVPHVLVFIIVLITWYFVEKIDPIEIKGQVTPKLICFKQSKVTTRYCATCHKSVEGLDHHCLWLNTCIGSKNYIPFFILVLSGFLQTGLQAVIGVLYLTLWFTPELKSFVLTYLHERWIYTVLISFQCLTSGVICFGLSTLLAFHLFLLFWARVGTYEWLLSRGDSSKPEDSYSEIQQKYLADQAERFEREQAWAQTMSKVRTPTHKQLSMSTMNTNGQINNSQPLTQSEKINAQNIESFLKPFNSCDLIVATDNSNVPTSKVNDSTLIPSQDLFNETPTDLELTPQNDDSSIAGHYAFYPHDNIHSHHVDSQSQDGNRNHNNHNNSNNNNNNNSNNNKKDQTVFRSLYLKASQVFPLTHSPSTSRPAKSSQLANQSELSPHPEISYHSILSHNESSHYSTNHDQPIV